MIKKLLALTLTCAIFAPVAQADSFDGSGNLKVVEKNATASLGTVGSAVLTKGLFILGSDGTNARYLKTDTSGELQVDILTAPTLTVNSHAVTNAGTFAVQAAQSGTWTLGANSGVDIGDVTLTASSNNIGDVDILTIAAGNNNIGDVDVASIAAGDNNIGNVDIVSLPALPAGTNGIGKLTANSGVDIGDVDVTSVGGTVTVGGTIAHGTGVSGNPVRIGARARTSNVTAEANDDTVDLMADTVGKLIVKPYSIPAMDVKGVQTTANTDTTSDQLIAADGALKIYVTMWSCMNDHATVSTWVNLLDGSEGTVLATGYVVAVGGGFVMTFPNPVSGTAATRIDTDNVTTGSSVKCTAVGYLAP